MRRNSREARWRAIFVAVFVVTGPAPFSPEHSYAQGSAQCGSYPELAPECAKEFDDWLKAADRWKAWKEQYGNFMPFARRSARMLVRPPRPAVPEWLISFCEPARGLSNAGPVCGPFHDHQEYDWTLTATDDPYREDIEYTYSASNGQTGENEGMIEFLLKRTHFDGVWTNSNNGPRSVGYFGMHFTMARLGRVHFWGPPGFIVLREPDGEVKMRKSYGLDVYLWSPRVPFTQTRVRLYASVAKLINPDGPLASGWSRFGSDMVGFSITLR